MDKNIFKKLNILIFTLIGLMILTVIVSSVIYSWQTKLLKVSFNKNQELQKEIDALKEQLFNFEQNREVHSIYPGPKYENDKHKFSMEIPQDWFIIGSKNSNFIENMVVGDKHYKNSFADSLLASEPWFAKGSILFSLTIFPKDNLEEKAPYFKDIKTDLEQAFSKGLVDKTEYNKGNGMKMELYVVSQKNDSWRYSSDKILPDADAFLEDEKYVYYFSTEDYLPMDEQRRKDIVEIMKKSLESFKFDK